MQWTIPCDLELISLHLLRFALHISVGYLKNQYREEETATEINRRNHNKFVCKKLEHPVAVGTIWSFHEGSLHKLFHVVSIQKKKCVESGIHGRKSSYYGEALAIFVFSCSSYTKWLFAQCNAQHAVSSIFISFFLYFSNANFPVS